MISIIDFGGGNALTLAPARKAWRLERAIGGARVVLEVDLGRRGASISNYFRLSAEVAVRARTHEQRLLARLDGQGVACPNPEPTGFMFTGLVLDHQLRDAEEFRDGMDPVWLEVRIEAVYVHPETGQFSSSSASLGIDLSAGEWGAELGRIEQGAYIEVLVPVATAADLAKAAARIRRARVLVRDGDVEEALGEARKALEVVRRRWATAQVLSKAPAPRAREQKQRWAAQVESTFSLLSGAVHDDEGTTEQFTWTRQEATTLVAAVAGYLAQVEGHADDRQFL